MDAALTDPVVVHPVIFDLHMPTAAGDTISFDVRCFLVPHGSGVVLVDTAVPGAAESIGAALAEMGAEWGDVTDIVLTHAHFDHTGGLTEVAARVPNATIAAGAADVSSIDAPPGRAIHALTMGDRVRNLGILQTPGHTPGHISLLHEDASLLLLGDIAGTVGGRASWPPAHFTADDAGNRRSLGSVLALHPMRVLPSHGAEWQNPVLALGGLLTEAGQGL